MPIGNERRRARHWMTGRGYLLVCSTERYGRVSHVANQVTKSDAVPNDHVKPAPSSTCRAYARSRVLAPGAPARPSRSTANYSITRVARTMTVGGIAMPIAFASFMFTASSNRIGCSIGNSLGLAPLRMRWTYWAPCAYNAPRSVP